MNVMLAFITVFEPWGRGGDFVLVLLVFSTITDNSM